MRILKIMTQAMVLTAVNEITDFCMQNSTSLSGAYLDPSYSFLTKDVRGIEGWNYTIDLRPDDLSLPPESELQDALVFTPEKVNNVRLIMQQQRQSLVHHENPNYYRYTYQILCNYSKPIVDDKENQNNQQAQHQSQLLSLTDAELKIVHVEKHPLMPSSMQEFVNKIIPLENGKELLIASSTSMPNNIRK